MFKEEWVIFETLTGSQAYSTATPDSDYDYRGILIPPFEYFISPFKKIEQYESTNPDRTIYEIRKFSNLASQNNPNIIELLFIDDKFIKTITPEGKRLRLNRHLFLSAKCRYTYSGYAFAQLKRIQTHKKWIMNPITVHPQRSDFGLSDTSSPISNDEYGMLKTEIEKGQKFSAEIIAVFEKEKEYRRALQEYTQYQSWLKTRNPKRALLEQKYGYDTKHAGHLVRLMIQCKEILTQGTLTVNLANHQEVFDVRDGKWSYEYLLKWATDIDKELDDIYINKKYVVPYSPEIEKIDKLTQDLIKEHFSIVLSKQEDIK